MTRANTSVQAVMRLKKQSSVKCGNSVHLIKHRDQSSGGKPDSHPVFNLLYTIKAKDGGDDAMKFYIDTANIDEIRKANALGILAGVTTNPSLVAKEGVSFHDRLREITDEVAGSGSAEIISEDAEGMIAEGKQLSAIAPNITVKIPMTLEGLKAVKTLSDLAIKTNVTLIFNANQALLAARAGATYVSPFLGRLDDIGHDGMELIATIADIFNRHAIDTEIIAASIRHPMHLIDAARNGAHIATLPYSVLIKLVTHPLTDQGIEKFLADWNKQNE